MKTTSLLVACLLSAAAVGTAQAAVSKEELQKALLAHPELVMDIVRAQRKELIEILNQAVSEDQEAKRKDAELQAEKEFDERIADPYKPKIDEKTRIRGDKNAKYTLVEYSDFQCPYCSRGYMVVEELRKKYGDDLRFVFKNKPLMEMHPEAMPAALFFEAVSLQSQEKGWLFHDKLFMNQNKLGAAFYEETAKALGVDVKRAKKDAASKELKEKVEADIAEAEAFGFSGTPGFLLNGVPLRGAYPPPYFDKIVQKLEKKSGAAPGAAPAPAPGKKD
ncbi:MAG: thioredoxin domain-containing protein [Elusimicrobia bacterium]|nr:thioredoxin domain-containing protein [Elusimicrobiota bacterium]